MHIPIDGYAVAYGVIAIAIGVLIWMPRWHIRVLHPVSMVAVLIGFVYLTIGVRPWLDALARLTSSGPGFVGLLIVAAFGAAVFLYEITRSRRDDGGKGDGKDGGNGGRKGDHKDDRARAYALAGAGIFGAAMIVVIANAGKLLREATHSPARTGHALAQTVHGITSGRAAHAQTLRQAVIIVVVALAGVAVLASAMRRHERRHVAPPARRERQAITSGPSPSGTSGRSPSGTPGRPEIPAPSRRGT